MGAYWSSDFYIYSRQKEDDKYQLKEELKEGNPMSRFKHEVYAYTLNKNYKDDKSLYLYCGYSRVAKAIIEGDDVQYLVITFCSEEAASEWDKCQEQMDKVYVDVIWLERPFLNSWVYHVEENFLVRKYQNYKMDMKK
jgi:hypothetical protein|tara:strand:+ start:5461 stop:5874 length:414 start_codon:yes stop_codon:yes gene_type:complete